MKEKTAFITGANKGIGFGIAKHLGLSGWRIIIGARNQERAEKAIRELIALGIDGLIRILRYLPTLVRWLISCA